MTIAPWRPLLTERVTPSDPVSAPDGRLYLGMPGAPIKRAVAGFALRPADPTSPGRRVFGGHHCAMLLQNISTPHMQRATCASRVDTPMTKRTLPGSTRWRLIVALLFSLTLALTPSLAEARAGGSFGGGGSSFGSRGARSFENNGAAPLSRTMETPSSGLAGGAAGGGSF